MDLTPYLDSLRRDLSSAAAPGGTDVLRAAELLTGALDAATRLCLMEVLADAAAEITTKLGSATVDVRLKGREAELVVTPLAAVEDEPVPPPAPGPDTGDLARITLRLAESLKEQVERSATAEGISVNAWLVRAVGTAVTRGSAAPPPGRQGPPRPLGKRITGFAQA
jgi:hypothetical protein